MNNFVSGTNKPAQVKRLEIPILGGGGRLLGIPIVMDCFLR